MLRSFQRSLVVTLVGIGMAGTQLRADDNIEQMVALYNKIALVLQGGRPDDKNVVSLAYPGLQIEEGFSQSVEADRNMLYQLFDEVPGTGAVYQPFGQKYSSVYSHILNDIVFKTTEMKPEDKAALEAALAVTDPNGTIFPNYLDYEKKFQKAQNDRDAANATYENAMEDQKLFRRTPDEVKKMSEEQKTAYLAQKQSLDKAVTDARSAKSMAENDYVSADNAWKGVGNKGKVMSAYNTINNMTNLDAGAWWTQLRSRFLLGSRNNGANQVVEFFPAPDTWNKAAVADKEDPTWMQVSFKADHAASQSSASSKAIDVQASFRAGKLRASGSGNWNKDLSSAASAENGFEMSFKIKKVAVFRPWMEMMVFKNENWWFNDNYKNDIVSFGDLRKSSDKLLMPMYLHTVILAKDIVMTSKSFKAFSSSFQEAVKVRAAVSYGPFSVSGGYSQHDKREHKESKVTETSITVPGVQILGYISSIVDRSPGKTVTR